MGLQRRNQLLTIFSLHFSFQKKTLLKFVYFIGTYRATLQIANFIENSAKWNFLHRE